MMKLRCFFKNHSRGKTKYLGDGYWYVKCKRCGYSIEYESPGGRLIGEEIARGFDGH